MVRAGTAHPLIITQHSALPTHLRRQHSSRKSVRNFKLLPPGTRIDLHVLEDQQAGDPETLPRDASRTLQVNVLPRIPRLWSVTGPHPSHRGQGRGLLGLKLAEELASDGLGLVDDARPGRHDLAQGPSDVGAHIVLEPRGQLIFVE